MKTGLLQRATLLKQGNENRSCQNDAKSSSDDKIITPEDVQQIQTQIDEIIRKNRTNQLDRQGVSHKNELAFPLIINGLVLVMSVLVVLWISYIVSKEEADLADQRGGLSSVEGHLIQRLRQDANFQLSEKDRELAEVRRQLMDLEKDQTNVLNQIEVQYSDRESEFQRLLAQDVAAERRRLIATEITAEQLDELLALYEQERFAYYQEALAKYRQQLNAERQEAESNYQRLYNQYQNNIKTINNERQVIRAEFQQKEQEVRIAGEVRLDQVQQSVPEAAEAQSTLASLETQRQQIQLEENRITGMFNQLRNALQQERYNDAVSQSESLLQYLEGSLQETPEARQRRSLDMYLASSLARIARTELHQTVERNPEIDALRTRVTSLEAENAQLTRLNNELSLALEQARQREGEITALLSRIAQNERELTNLNTRIMQLEQENARLILANQNLSQNTDSDSQYETHLSALTSRIGQLEQENAKLNQLNTELGALTGKITQLERENARLAQTNQELAQAADRTRRNEASLTARITQLEQENARLNRLNQDLTQASVQNRQNEASIAMLTSRIGQLEAENVRLTQINQNVSQNSAAERQQRQTDIAALNNRITQLETENTRLTQLNQEFARNPAPPAGGQQNQEDLTVLNNRIAQLEEENIRLTQANQGLSQQTIDQAQQHKADTADLSNQITRLETENTRLIQANQELAQQATARGQQNQEDLAVLNNRIAQLEGENTRLAQANQELAQQTPQAPKPQQDAPDLTNQISRLEQENAKLNQTNQELSQQAATQDQQRKADAANLTNRIGQLEQENAKLNQTNQELSQKVEKTKDLPDEKQIQAMIRAGHKEGIANVTNILETSLRIPTEESRKKYLEGIKPRYANEPDILSFIELLITRL
ncbi:MAG: hypothetical protein LBD29_10140 [Treponema sp.]|nr:hypothetical protein [Treponema sp.]